MRNPHNDSPWNELSLKACCGCRKIDSVWILTSLFSQFLNSKKIQIVNLFFQQDYDTRSCEFTFPLYMDELCVIVKKAGRIPSIILPLVIFDENLWLSLFSTGIFICIIWSILRTLNNILKRPLTPFSRTEFYIESYNFTHFLATQSEVRQYFQIFIDSWLYFLSIPVRRFTRVQNERLLIGAVCLTSLIFVNLYQSGMSTVYVEPIYYKDINSLKQLDSSGIEINVKYPGYMTDVFPNDSTGTIRNLHNKMHLKENEKFAMDMVNNSKNIASITRKSTAKLDNSIYFIRKDLHLVAECPRNYFLAYMVPVHSPYLERINEILFDIHRFGFIIKWINDLNFQETLRLMKSFHREKSKVLSLDDLRFAFILCIFGNSLGVLILLIEYLISKYKRGIFDAKKN